MQGKLFTWKYSITVLACAGVHIVEPELQINVCH